MNCGVAQRLDPALFYPLRVPLFSRSVFKFAFLYQYSRRLNVHLGQLSERLCYYLNGLDDNIQEWL
jgi:hypothetical protein